MSESAIEAWTSRIAAEFGECPGLRLTSAQAARLWHIDISTVTAILEGLVQRAELARTPDGAFIGARRAR